MLAFLSGVMALLYTVEGSRPRRDAIVLTDMKLSPVWRSVVIQISTMTGQQSGGKRSAIIRR